MTVKQTVDGIYLYFAHNTDSFVSTGIFSLLQLIANGRVALGARQYEQRGQETVFCYVSQQRTREYCTGREGLPNETVIMILRTPFFDTFSAFRP